MTVTVPARISFEIQPDRESRVRNGAAVVEIGSARLLMLDADGTYRAATTRVMGCEIEIEGIRIDP